MPVTAFTLFARPVENHLHDFTMKLFLYTHIT
jgi:hypothetical protein